MVQTLGASACIQREICRYTYMHVCWEWRNAKMREKEWGLAGLWPETKPLKEEDGAKARCEEARN